MNPSHPHFPRRRGFTLIELMVTVGIIALLIAIAVPVIMVSYKKAGETRVAAEMQSIGVALDAYKANFGDYPRPEPGEINDGFAILGKALFSPGGEWTGTALNPIASAAPYTSGAYETGQCVSYGSPQREYLAFTSVASQPPTDTSVWMQFPYTDGKSGPGFRVRSMGKTYGPYLQADKFKLRGLAVLDYYGNPILYFTASLKRINTNVAGGFNYVDDSFSPVGAGSPIYDAAQNLLFFERLLGSTPDTNRKNAMSRMTALMVQNVALPTAAVNSTAVVAPQSAITTGPYLLWSAGPDGFYGAEFDQVTNMITKKTLNKCDDVMNFNR